MVIIEIPKTIYSIVKYLPNLLIGSIFPYLTLVTVAKHYHNISSQDLIFEFGSLDFNTLKIFIKWLMTEINNNLIIVCIIWFYQGDFLS